MPEGPSIVILCEEMQRFVGHRIVAVSGTDKVDKVRLGGQVVAAVRSWGKHFLIEFPTFALRIHLLLFGSYRIDERKQTPPRLRLQFDNGEVSFHGCSIQLIEGSLDEHYDWSVDVMSPQWSPAAALARLRSGPRMLACDALLDQDLFAGAGDIFKNEVLFHVRVHPLSRIGALPPRKLRQLVDAVRSYAFEFLESKKAGVLKRHWQAHRQSQCPRCQIPLTTARLGRGSRPSFFCERCQKLYQ